MSIFSSSPIDEEIKTSSVQSWSVTTPTNEIKSMRGHTWLSRKTDHRELS